MNPSLHPWNPDTPPSRRRVTAPSAARAIAATLVATASMLQIASAAPAPAKKAPVLQIPSQIAEAQEEIKSNMKPSRFVSKDEMPGYVATVTAIFSMKSRQRDPFGQVQDPNAKPAVVQKSNSAPRVHTPVKATPFSDIIKRIRVNTIMPAEQSFLIGDRSFKSGDRFPLAFKGKLIQVEVVAVSATEINFKDLSSGEVSTITLNVLPPGMKAGTSGITAPGMSSSQQPAPLDVESLAD